MSPDNGTDVRVSAAIPPELHARIQAIRAARSVPPGNPDEGPPLSALIRQALEMFVASVEAAR